MKHPLPWQVVALHDDCPGSGPGYPRLPWGITDRWDMLIACFGDEATAQAVVEKSRDIVGVLNQKIVVHTVPTQL